MGEPSIERDREFGIGQAHSSSPAHWLIWAILLLLTASTLTTEARADEPLRLNGVIYLGDLPTLIADEYGLFREHDLDITIEHTASGKSNLEALRAGNTDMALMALTPFVLERLRTPDMAGPDTPVILASLIHSTWLNDVIVPADSAVNAPGDLVGRRVGLEQGTNSEYLWWLFSIYHGLSPDAATLVDYPVAELGEALATDAIDAAVIWEPWTTLANERNTTAIERLPGGDIYTEKWVLVGTQRLVSERPHAVRGVLAGYRAAIEWIEAHPDPAFARFATAAGISEATARGHIDRVLFGLSLDWSLIAELQQHVEWARTTGQDVRVTETDLLSWIAAEPLRAIRPAAVTIPRHAGDEAQP